MLLSLYDNIHPMIAHDLKVLHNFVKNRDANNLQNRFTACKEPFIENRSIVNEESFTEVISNTHKKNAEIDYMIYNFRQRGRKFA